MTDRRKPVGCPSAERSMLPPGGSGVLPVIPAARRAAELTRALWRSARTRATGVLPLT